MGDDITSPMKSMTMSGGRKGGRMDDNNGKVDHLKKTMLGLADNQETLSLKVNALADYAVEITLFFLQGNMEERKYGKISEDTCSLYNLLAED